VAQKTVAFIMAVTTLFLVWDDIAFDTDCIRIKPERVKQIVMPIPFKGAMPSLNAIKSEYFEKKYSRPFKLVFLDSALSKPHSPAWAELNDLIEKAIAINRFSNVPKTIRRKPVAHKKESRETIKSEKVEAEKPDYLKVLARLQSNHYRLITIQEKYQGHCEESHIYRFETGSGRILMVWENTNASRAAYLFVAKVEEMQDRLCRIEAFIHTDNVLFKRSRFQKLKENKALRAELGFVDSVHHESLAQFETDIKTFINRY
jgi:hypothetical protein